MTGPVSDGLALLVEQLRLRRETRYAQIRRLLATRNDHLPEPVRRDHAASGFVHRVDASESCPDCFGETPGRVGCSTCHGRGAVVVRRTRDPYAVSRTSPYGLTGDRHEQARERDREIDRLVWQTRPPWPSPQDELEDANLHPYGWEHARAAMYARFDYRPLETALERLAAALPDVSPMSLQGLRFIEPHMPDPIRAPDEPPPLPAVKGRAVSAHSRGRRDAEVRKMLAQNPPAIVARMTGLSLSTVYAIRRSMAAGEAA